MVLKKKVDAILNLILCLGALCLGNVSKISNFKFYLIAVCLYIGLITVKFKFGRSID